LYPALSVPQACNQPYDALQKTVNFFFNPFALEEISLYFLDFVIMLKQNLLPRERELPLPVPTVRCSAYIVSTDPIITLSVFPC
jgi:hypothetical protein